MPAVRCHSSFAPRRATPANPHLSLHNVRRLQRPATESQPLLPTSGACLSTPADALTASPAMPNLARCHRDKPCLPFLALARPRLARRALPRSASPTSPNQQRQASASTVPTPCLPVLAWPCLTKPCLPCPSIPVLATLRHATPAPPSRLGRSDLTGPCLRNLGTPHVA